MSFFCEECGNKYINYLSKIAKWCRPCQINSLKNHTTISDNEKINNFIQEMQLKIYSRDDIVFEWIPYNQFNDINKINDFTNAIWTDGRLEFCSSEKKYQRVQNIKSFFKIPTINIDKFLNEANNYSIKTYQFDIRIIYGISQNPDTKEYIMVLGKDGCCERCDNLYTSTLHCWCKPCQINLFKENFTNWTVGMKKLIVSFKKCNRVLVNLQDGKNNPVRYGISLSPNTKDYIIVLGNGCYRCNKSNIKEIGKNDCFTTYSAMWKDGPLNYSKDKDEYVRSQNNQNKTIILKCLPNKPEDFINEVKHIQLNTVVLKLNTEYLKIQIQMIT
ncbi:unnamed protein product [Rhizophagus irregularis]|nr:unnamed protein product [Rhizophagus irregularis]